jgi:hypothetical protein
MSDGQLLTLWFGIALFCVVIMGALLAGVIK